MVKNLPANAGDMGDAVWFPGWGRSLEEEVVTPVFLSRKSQGQRSLAG